MAFSIEHTVIGSRPHWYHVQNATDLKVASRIAYDYAMTHGGYVCVKDGTGHVVFGTDPLRLDLAILNGTNRDFPREAARRVGCCA